MLRTEIINLGDLRVAAEALVDYASTLLGTKEFEATLQHRYVAVPSNFVTFKVHFKRTKNLTVTLRGNPQEFPELYELPLKKDMGGYSSFKLTSIEQLAAAAFYIRTASEIFTKGREREQRRRKIVEV